MDERLTLAFVSQLQLEEALREVLRKQATGTEVFTTANRAQQDASYSRSKVVDLTDGMDQLGGRMRDQESRARAIEAKQDEVNNEVGNLVAIFKEIITLVGNRAAGVGVSGPGAAVAAGAGQNARWHC
jgi:hypothetical protein